MLRSGRGRWRPRRPGTLRYSSRSRCRSRSPRGCGGIGRRAAFRSPWGQPRGGSSPLIRIIEVQSSRSPREIGGSVVLGPRSLPRAPEWPPRAFSSCAYCRPRAFSGHPVLLTRPARHARSRPSDPARLKVPLREQPSRPQAAATFLTQAVLSRPPSHIRDKTPPAPAYAGPYDDVPIVVARVQRPCPT